MKFREMISKYSSAPLSILLTAVALITTDTVSAYLSPTETPIANYLAPINVSEFDSGVEHIDCIYVINLDYRTDKWNRLVPIFEKMNMKVNRMSAVIGNLLSNEDKDAMSGKYPVSLSGAEIGCLLSHLSIINDAHERDFNIIWICEDDIEFVEDVSIIPKIIENLTAIDPNWDILYTDSNCRNPDDGYYYPISVDPRPDQVTPSFDFMNKRTSIDADLMRIRIRYGTTSMIISRKGIEKILNYFTHVYLWCPIDHDIHYIPRLKEYALKRDAITNLRRGFPGDIHWVPY